MRIAAVAVTAAALAACNAGEARHKPVPPGKAAELLHERIWLDHAPRTPNEKFELALFDEGGSGIRQRRTVWKGDFELFFYEVDGNDLEFFLPASGTAMHTSFRIVPEAGPDHADHKLVIDHPPTGPREYWGWRMEGHDRDAWLAAQFGGDAAKK